MLGSSVQMGRGNTFDTITVTGTASFGWAIGFVDATAGLRLNDDINMLIGSGHDAIFLYESADANAKMVHLSLPETGQDANNVPVLALGDRTIFGADLGGLGPDFSGVTAPTIGLIAADGAGYVSLACGDDDIMILNGTTSPSAEADETKFSAKLQCAINGTTYYIMLTET